MPTKIKQRTVARAKLTKTKNNISQLLETEAEHEDKAFFDKLDEAVSELNNKLYELEKLDDACLADLADEEIEAAVEESDAILQSAKEVRRTAMNKIHQLESKFKSSDDVDEKTSNVSTRAKVDVKLPKLELPKFGGEVLEWPSFWDRFSVAVDQLDTPAVNKFVYLDSLLYGEAKETIKGITLSADNYESACVKLQERYGRQELIIFKHIQELLSISLQGKVTYQNLRKHHDAVASHVRCLESYGITAEQYGMFLTPIVLSTLPFDIRMEWSRQSTGLEGDFEFMLNFLEKEVRVRETSAAFKPLKTETSKKEEKNKFKSSAAALTSNSISKPNCNICFKIHLTHRCFQLIDKEVSERWDLIKKSKLCARCLSKWHSDGPCNKSCERCNGSHHKLLCSNNNPRKDNAAKQTEAKDAKTDKEAKKDDSKEKEVSHSHSVYTTRIKTPGVLLQIIKVNLKGKGEQNSLISANLLFDIGADRSYINSDLLCKIKSKFVGTVDLSVSGFGSTKPSPEVMRNIYTVDLHGMKNGCGTLDLTEVPVITTPIHREKLSEEIISQI